MKNCRIHRGDLPTKRITKRQYRHALIELKRDFDNRCAYCMRKIYTDSEMEVDHFNPRKKKSTRQNYSNLFLADSHCNKAKGKKWPTKAARRRGIRFLNCCKEIDYGGVVFEEPDTHILVGTTDAARYHILQIDLNNDDLIALRKRRSEAWEKFDLYKDIPRGAVPRMEEIMDGFASLLECEIPPIPPPPAEKSRNDLG